MLKLGEEAATGPVTSTVYVPAVITPSKSIACTNPYVWLHDPTLAPTVPVKTVAPLEFLTANVAPVSSNEDMRYARFAADEG